MKHIKIFSLFFFVACFVVGLSAQTNKNKKQHWSLAFLEKRPFLADSIYVLRVPDIKIESPAKTYILSVQTYLEDMYIRMNGGGYFNPNGGEFMLCQMKIEAIEQYDANWQTQYYETELNTYKVKNNTPLKSR